MEEHPESPQVAPNLPPTAKQEDAMWNALCDSAADINGPRIIIVQQSVYNHDVYGPFDDLEIAKDCLLYTSDAADE